MQREHPFDVTLHDAVMRERLLLKEGTDLLFRNATSSIVAAFICAVAYGGAVWGHVPTEHLLPWGGLILAVTGGRWLHARRYVACDPVGEECHRWRRRFMVGIVASGTIWGYAGLFLFVADSSAHQAFYFIIASGLAVGGVFSYPTYPAVGPTFAALSLLPLALRYILTGGVGVAAGFLLAVFVAALSVASRRFSAMVAASLGMRFQNAELVAEAEGARERFEILARATAEGVLIHRDGIVLDVNDKICEIVGVPPKTMVGAHVSAFIAPEYREEVGRRLASSADEPYEIELLLPGDRRIPVEVEGRTVPYNGGNARVVALRDLTTRRAGEQALRESRSLLLEAMDVAGIASWRFDEATGLMTLGERFHLVMGDETLDPVVGVMTPAAFEERFLPPDDQGNLHHLLERALVEETLSGELRVRRADGTDGFVALRLRAERRPDGRRVVHGITYDVTERMRAFNDLTEAKQKADQANFLKGRFVSLVSHDLKSPLSGVLSVLRLLQEDRDLDPELRRTLVAKSAASVEGLIGFINQILDHSRISEGTLAPRKEFLDPLVLVQRQIENVLPAAEKKGVVIETELATPVRFFADPALLGQALANLLSNAIKFTPPGGKVVVATEEGNRLSVADTGVGVDPSFLPDLFRQEVRTSSFGTAGEKGSGMGLPFAADVVQAHRGTLTVASAPGQGTRFTITLPVVKRVVLIVEDEPAHRQMMRRLAIGLDGVDTVEAIDGREGLAALARGIPDLIVTDIQMPVVDGFAFIEEVRKNPALDHVPIIVATAAWTVGPRDQLDLRQKGMQKGASDFVIKPVTEANFVPALRRYLPA
ncbi:MAG: response regulator [Nitrospinae bacterium]|nr:response regulator [Nitrospinota bacterium]